MGSADGQGNTMNCPLCSGAARLTHTKKNGYLRYCCPACGHKWNMGAKKLRGRPRLPAYPPPSGPRFAIWRSLVGEGE